MKAFAWVVGLACVSSAMAAEPLAFPGAEGFGAYATGGRGCEVVHVTNLDDSGPGSLRDAVSQPNRTVVFDVGGVIRIKNQIAFSDNLTVAGQTAPGGITIFGSGISLSNRTNVIVRYLTVRCGSTAGRSSKSLNITNGKNIIVDHLSLSWASWDNAGLTGGTSDMTMQHCILSEAIKVQNFGAIIDGVQRTSIIRNLWIHNRGRNPKGKGNLQFINNVIYNWGTQGYGGGHSGAVWKQDLQGNYLIAGPNSNNGFFTFANANDHIYSDGNFVDLNKDGTLDGRAWTEADLLKPDEKTKEFATPTTQPANLPKTAVKVKTAQEAVTDAIAGAGNSLFRDTVDQRLIEELKSFGKLGKNPDHEADVGGLPEIAPTTQTAADTDRDGMPDAWENANGLNPSNADDARKILESGYSQLEVYLNSLVAKN